VATALFLVIVDRPNPKIQERFGVSSFLL